MSKVSICNKALTSLGANTIISIDEETTEAILCKLHYDLVLNNMLEAASWTFATRRMQLPLSGESVPEPFAGKFLIPVAVVRILESGATPDFDREVNTTYWQEEADYILSEKMTCYIRAVFNDIDTAKFTPSFEKAFVSLLASAIALAITQSASTQQMMEKQGGQMLQFAATMDASKGRTRKLRSNKYLNVRRSAGGGYFQSYKQG